MEDKDLHGSKEHIHPRIPLNKLFELLQTWNQILWIITCIFDLLVQPSVLDAMVGRQPGPSAMDKVVVWNVVFVAVLMDHFQYRSIEMFVGELVLAVVVGE